MINREQAKAYLKRWDAVAEVEKKELSSTSLGHRLIQTLSLMGMGFAMAANNLTKIKEDSHSINQVRRLWVTIKEKNFNHSYVQC